MNECVICRENLFLAVEMTCFRCYQQNHVSCSSFCRVCRKCAHSYLQLDRPLEHRDLLKRCLYCRALCSTLNLSAETAYRKDFLLIGSDASTGHTCPYCSAFTGTQLSIDQHLDSQCPEMVILCSCGTTNPRKLLAAHYLECPERQPCTVCHLFFRNVDVEDHMMRAHRQMRCALCDAYVAYHVMTLHIMNDCPHRTVHCNYCEAAVQYKTLPTHMEEHEAEFYTTFQRLMRNITTALREYNRFRRARNAHRSASQQIFLTGGYLNG